MSTAAWHSVGTFHRDRPRKHRYRDLLVRPNTIQIGHRLQRGGMPRWYPGTREAWDADVQAICRREAISWKRRVVDLGDSYGIRIDVEPNEGDGWHQLALALARSHVPGFSHGELDYQGAKNIGRRRTSLSAGGTFTFAVMVYVALNEGISTSHTIAKFITDRQILRTWIPKVGKRRYEDFAKHRRTLPFETAKYYVPQIRSAWRDVRRGNATPFQYQALAESLKERKSPPSWKIWRVVFGLNVIER
jgi:hypothetical protein